MSISDIPIHNPVILFEVSIPEVAFPEDRLFKRFRTLLTYSLKTIDELCQQFLEFRASLWKLTSAKNFYVQQFLRS